MKYRHIVFLVVLTMIGCGSLGELLDAYGKMHRDQQNQHRWRSHNCRECHQHIYR